MRNLLIAMIMPVFFLVSCAGGAADPSPELAVATATVEPTPSSKPTTTSEPTPTQTLSQRLPSSPSPEPTTTQIPDLSGESLLHPVRLEKDLPADLISILGTLPDGKILLESKKKIIAVGDGGWEVFLSDVPGEPIGVDKVGRVWIADQSGRVISSWDGSAWIDYTAEDGWLPLGKYSHVQGRPAVDDLGQIWFVTDEDLRVFNGQDWFSWAFADLGVSHPLDREEGLYPLLNVYYLESIDQIWVASCNWTGAGPIGGQGVLRFDGQSWAAPDPDLSDGCAEVILEDDQGGIWMGLDGNIWRYDPQTGGLADYGTPQSPFEDGGSFGQVDDIQLDLENNPWGEFLFCGGAGCGFGPIFYRFEAGEWIQVVQDFQYQRKLVIDSVGTPWLFTHVGVFRFSGDQLDQVAGINLNPYSVTVDSDGRVWFIVKEELMNELWVIEPGLPTAPAAASAGSLSGCTQSGEASPLLKTDLFRPDFELRIAAYLNASGDAEELESILTGFSHAELEPDSPEPVLAEVTSADVTGNSLADVLVGITVPYGNGFGETTFSIYHCQNGKYIPQVLFSRRGAGSRAEGLYRGGGARVLFIQDLNQNSVAEVVFSVNWPGYAEIYVAEWSGEEFISLIPRYQSHLLDWVTSIPINPDQDTLQLEDVTGDGLLDIIISGPRQCAEASTCTPSATRTEIWSWNGESYQLSEPQSSASETP